MRTRFLLKSTVGLALCAGLAAAPTTLNVAAASTTQPSTVPATTKTATAEQAAGNSATVVIAKGHVDVGPKYINGTWQAALRDDTVNPAVWRPLSDVVLRVVDAAKTEVPSSPEYGFLKLPAGSKPWVIPQTQNPDVVWLGWNTQDPEAASKMGRGTNLVLNGMNGPAPVNVFLQDGGFGPPRILWQTEKGPGQSIWMEVNSHVHMNWVFAQPGMYTFDVAMNAEAGDPAPSAQGKLKIMVGDGPIPTDSAAGTNPSATTPAGSSTSGGSAGSGSSGATNGPATSGATSPDVTSSQAAVKAGPANTNTPAPESGTSPWLPIGAGIGLALIGGSVVWVAIRQRRARLASETSFTERS